MKSGVLVVRAGGAGSACGGRRRAGDDPARRSSTACRRSSSAGPGRAGPVELPERLLLAEASACRRRSRARRPRTAGSGTDACPGTARVLVCWYSSSLRSSAERYSKPSSTPSPSVSAAGFVPIDCLSSDSRSLSSSSSRLSTPLRSQSNSKRSSTPSRRVGRRGQVQALPGPSVRPSLSSSVSTGSEPSRRSRRRAGLEKPAAARRGKERRAGSLVKRLPNFLASTRRRKRVGTGRRAHVVNSFWSLGHLDAQKLVVPTSAFTKTACRRRA